MGTFKVLVCDDEPDFRAAMHLLLKSQGYQAVTVGSPRELLNAARVGGFDLILTDLNYTRDTTSGQEGLDLLRTLEARGNTTPVIVMTAWGSTDLAVAAMRRGACDFIQKPWDNGRVLAAVEEHASSQRQRKSELEIAAAVQQKLLPGKARPFETIDYAGRCLAARGIGGDYYDFLDLGDQRLGLVLADVSGKGVPAALLMANLQACFRSQAASEPDPPASVVEFVNRHFYASTEPDRFATLFFAVYDDRARVLRYVNCGHVAPLLLRATGEIERLEPTATVVGAFPEWSCAEGETRLAPGDRLLLYSDGVTDAEDQAGNEFGENRLLHAMGTCRAASAEHLVSEVLGAVSRFSGFRGDDITVVIICSV